MEARTASVHFNVSIFICSVIDKQLSAHVSVSSLGLSAWLEQMNSMLGIIMCALSLADVVTQKRKDSIFEKKTMRKVLLKNNKLQKRISGWVAFYGIIYQKKFHFLKDEWISHYQRKTIHF